MERPTTGGFEDPPWRVAALIPSEGRGSFALRCAESIRQEWVRTGGPEERLEIVVAEQGAEEECASWGDALLALGARIVGPAGGRSASERLAAALATTRGGASDLVLLAAADGWLLPGSLAELCARLEREPRAGAVLPRSALDEELQVLLPPARSRAARERALEQLARRASALAAPLAAARAARLAAWWEAQEPRAVRSVHGGCILARRSLLVRALERARSTDLDGLERALERELRRSGLCCELVPSARVLHHGSRWCEAAPARRAGLADPLWRALGTAPRALRPPPWAGLDLGPLTEPPTFQLPRLARFWIEIAPSGAARAPAAILGAGAWARPSSRAWSWLAPGSWSARAFDRASAVELGAWRFEKRGARRSWPLDPAGLARHEPSPAPSAARRAAERP